MICSACMNSTPWMICLMNATQAFSVKTNSSSITRSKSSPPPMLKMKKNTEQITKLYNKVAAQSMHQSFSQKSSYIQRGSKGVEAHNGNTLTCEVTTYISIKALTISIHQDFFKRAQLRCFEGRCYLFIH